jgi:hypothetical protein
LHDRYQARRPSVVVAKYFQAWWTKCAAIKFQLPARMNYFFCSPLSRTLTHPRELLELIYLHANFYSLFLNTLACFPFASTSLLIGFCSALYVAAGRRIKSAP